MLGLALPAGAAAQVDELVPSAPSAPEAVRPADDAVERAPRSERRAHARPANVRISIDVKGAKGGKVDVGDRVRAVGRVRPFVPGQRVRILLARRGKEVQAKRTFVKPVRGKDFGRVKFRSKPLTRAGKYRIRIEKERTDNQAGGTERSKPFSLRFPDLDPGDRNQAVRAFHKLLRKRGYHAPSGKKFSSATGRAVLAFRKVNGMARNMNATPQIFAKLASGKGGFKLKYPGAGKHVEVDISRQVMVLAAKGKPQHTFHVSTGAPGTPSDRGHFRFYRKDPGFNSLGMYYSVYYNRGEATHGYKSVPNYPASHGCIRNPIPNSVFIYNWIDLGDDIWVYN
jgi:hypothetical protein